MKRFTLVLISLLTLLALPARAQITVTAANAANSYSNASTCSSTFAGAATNPSLIVFVISGEASNRTYSVSDGVGSYTQDVISGTTGYGRGAVFSRQNTSTSTLTVTATITGGNDWGFCRAFQLVGAATSSALDSTATAMEASGASQTMTLTTLTDQAAAFAVGSMYPNSTIAADSGFSAAWAATGLNAAYHFGEYDNDVGSHAGKTLTMGQTNPASIFSVAAAAYKLAGASAATQDQEGFRWGVDDANEAGHTFEAAQDTNISINDTQSRLLRAIVNATGDPASLTYTLRYQKNGSGGYAAVPVGSGGGANEVYVNTSANITASGEATTARLTAPATKTTSDFVTGRRWDDENGTDSIDITADDYTEVEWLVALSAAPNPGDYFDFRVYAGSSALDTYSVTPRWTVPGASTAIGPLTYYYRLLKDYH